MKDRRDGKMPKKTNAVTKRPYEKEKILEFPKNTR
jgi:hypothetical protein